MRRVTPARRWPPAAAVLGVVLVASLGGYVVTAALSEPAGRLVTNSGVVSVQPLSGWKPAEPRVVAGRPVERITRGSGTLAVFVWGQVAGDAGSLAALVIDEILRDQLDRLTVSEILTPVSLDKGLEAQRFTFVGIDRGPGTAVEGEVTTVVTGDGQGVVFVGLAPEGLLAFVDGDLHTMIADARFGLTA
jgi:hypothetical protein